MEPRNTNAEGYKGFTNANCPYLPCHKGVSGEFNCLFCYCPLIVHDCPGPYRVFVDHSGFTRKDCSACTVPHDGYEKSWRLIQRWIEKPRLWYGREQSPNRLRDVEAD